MYVPSSGLSKCDTAHNVYGLTGSARVHRAPELGLPLGYVGLTRRQAFGLPPTAREHTPARLPTNWPVACWRADLHCERLCKHRQLATSGRQGPPVLRTIMLQVLMDYIVPVSRLSTLHPSSVQKPGRTCTSQAHPALAWAHQTKTTEPSLRYACGTSPTCLKH